MNYFLDALKSYADFHGRSSRKEFWLFALFGLFIFPFTLILIEESFFYIYSLFILIPTLAILTRRLHDTGKNGAFLFLLLIPYFGLLIVLILCLQEGDIDTNAYSPEPEDSKNRRPNHFKNHGSYSKTAELNQEYLVKQQNINTQGSIKKKGYGCIFASSGVLLGGIVGGFIGDNIGLSKGYTGGDSIGTVLFGIMGVPIGAILGLAAGVILGSKKKN